MHVADFEFKNAKDDKNNKQQLQVVKVSYFTNDVKLVNAVME